MNMLPQEIEVLYVIPAIRRDMAVCFSKEHGLSYDKIALMMGLTKTAISLYVAGKRVEKIKVHPKALKEIKISCKKVVENKSKVINEISRVLEFIKKKKLHCEMCGQMIDGKLHDCIEVEIPEAII